MQQGLVIDDHPIVREGLKDLLQKAVPALSITTSPGTEGVLEEVCGRHWAFIVLDLNLPRFHGLDEASSKIGIAQSRGSRSICGGRARGRLGGASPSLRVSRGEASSYQSDSDLAPNVVYVWQWCGSCRVAFAVVWK